VVKAAEDDAGEVDRLCEVAHQRALDAHHVPPAEGKTTDFREAEKDSVLTGILS